MLCLNNNNNNGVENVLRALNRYSVIFSNKIIEKEGYDDYHRLIQRSKTCVYERNSKKIVKLIKLYSRLFFFFLIVSYILFCCYGKSLNKIENGTI